MSPALTKAAKSPGIITQINGAATLKIQPGQFVRVVSDGTNYQVYGIPSGAQLPGTTTNDAGNAGNVGEYIESVVAQGSAVALTTNVAKDVTTITLTAGDWDISGNIGLVTAATTSVTQMFAGISATLNTMDFTNGRASGQVLNATVPTAGANYFLALNPVRFSINASTTYHLVAQGTFTVAALTAFGIIRARRVR